MGIRGARLDDGQTLARSVENVARELARSIAAGEADQKDAFEMVLGAVPRLYETHLSRGGPGGDFELFAISFTEFAKRVRARGLFRGLAMTDDLIVAAFDAHCQGGELFLFEAGQERPSLVPVSRSDIELVQGLDAGAMKSLFKGGYSAVSDLHAATELIGLRGAAKEHSDFLMGAQSLYRSYDAPSMAFLVKTIYSDGMLRGMQGFIKRFKEWFLVDLSDIVLAGAQAALQRVDAGDIGGTKAEVDGILEKVRADVEAIRQFGSLCNKLESMLDLLELGGDGPSGLPGHAVWREYQEAASMFTHDYANMMSGVIGSIDLLSTQLAPGKRGVRAGAGLEAARASLKEVLRSFDSSEVGAIMRLVKWMLKKKFDYRIVVDAADVGSLWVPPHLRSPLVEMLFELGLNAVKNVKDEGRIDLRAGWDGPWVGFSVEDNGVGIEDVERAIQLGVRERPDLVEGTGTGLASVMRQAGEIGAKVRIFSTPGVGTKATVSLNSAIFRTMSPRPLRS